MSGSGHTTSQSFTVDSELKVGAPLPLPADVFAAGAKLEQLASGFSNIAGLTTDDEGHLYFTDAAMHRIYRWNADAKKAELLTDKVTTPMAAGFAGDGSLLVLDYSRSVFAVDTKTGEATKIEPANACR